MSTDKNVTERAKAESPAQPAAESGVIASVRTWLESQGYPLEMRVARDFHAAGAEVQQSDFYVSTEGKAREIDVSARFGEMWKRGALNEGDERSQTEVDTTNEDEVPADAVTVPPQFVFFDLFVVVECKSGPKSQKPWVVFTSTRNRLPSLTRFQRLGTDGGKAIMDRLAKDPEIARLELFKMTDAVGYSMSVMKPEKAGAPDKNEHDQAFAALSSLAAAARGRVSPIGVPALFTMCRIVLPILVVDTPIVECWLDDDGGLQLQERDRMTLVWRNPIGEDPHTIIEILHERVVPKYVGHVYAAFDAFRRRKGDIEEAISYAGGWSDPEADF